MKRPLYNANDCFYFLYTCVISIFYWCAFILSSRTEIFFGGHINYRLIRFARGGYLIFYLSPVS